MSENNAGSREAALAAARQALLRKRIQGVSAAAAPPRAIPRRPDPERAPLSFAQQRLWFIDQLSPGNPSYNIPFPVRLLGSLDPAALERALREVVRRQEALRTVIAVDDAGNPVQRILPPPELRLPVADLGDVPAEEREAAMLRRVGAEVRRPFDLAAGPLFRAELLRLEDTDHVLALTIHHVVGDGFSTHLLLREIAALYDAFSRGLPSPLPELRAQYGDFAVWQRNRLQGAAFEKQVAFWTGKLRGAPPLLDLPADHARPPVHGHRGGTLPLSLPAETTDRLRAIAREEGTTLFNVVLAALSAHLGRYAHQDDVVVGVPVDNRGLPELEEIVGVFLNTLPIRTSLAGDPTFRETLARARAETAAAFAHQDVQFEKLVDDLKIERNLSYPPIFQVMLTFNEAHGQPGAAEGAPTPALRFRPVQAEAGNVSFDLVLVAGADPSGVLGVWQYSAELFDEATVARMAREFERLLERVAAEPDAPLSALSVLEGPERDRVLVEWNRTARDYPAADGLHGLVRRWVERTPDAVALVSGDERVGYAELDRRAARLARRLAARGVGPETRVGICTSRDTGMVVAILAVLKAGGAYVPIDPTYPAERIDFLLRDSGVPLLLTDAAVRGGLPPFGGQVLRVDEAGEEDGEPFPAPDPENAAYVIYTSGSTGTPKGVVVTHRAACNVVQDAVERFGVAPGNRTVHTAAVGFDASVIEIFLPLAAGAELHLVDRDTVRSADELAALLREREIDVWVSTPALLEALSGEELPALRVVSSGGDRLGGETARRWSEGRRLLNMYGPTETTVFSASHQCAPGSADAPPVGRPAAHTRVYVVDAELRPVVPGIPGEILIGGRGVARGYLGRPELTAERFVPDPFSGEPGARVYRTGDLGRLRPDGELEFRGRVDQQVKIRGFRIEPGEIEAALLALDGVREAAVLARDDGPGGPRLVAYLVPDGSGTMPDDPRPALRRRLPEHMVPSAFVPLAELPRTPNGKLDRRALPAPDARRDEQREYVAPRTALETVLAGVWAEVLGRERVGIDDNFFDLGGHSLLATQVSIRMRSSKIPMPVRMLFQHPTLQELAQAIVAGESRPGQTEKVASLILKVQSLTPEARQQLLQRAAAPAAEVGG